MSVGSLPFPGPRRLPPGLSSNPKAGSAPSILDLMTEGATTTTPPPDVVPPEDMPWMEQLINNPSLGELPEEVMSPAMLQLVMQHGATGSMPGLKRSLMDQVAQTLIRQLDFEAAAAPSLSRRLLQSSAEPGIDELFAMSGDAPKLSSFFQGHDPLRRPDQTYAGVETLLARLEEIEPVQQDARALDIEERMVNRGGVADPWNEHVTQRMAQKNPGTARIRTLLEQLAHVGQIGQMGDPTTARDQLMVLLSGMADSVSPTNFDNTLLAALAESGIGSGRQMPGADPTTSRSLAPDFDPRLLRDQIVGGSGTDPDLIMRLMGMGPRTTPQGGI